MLCLSSAAIADRGHIGDPRGDVKHHPPGQSADWDLTQATWRHRGASHLVHTVSVAGQIGNPRTGRGSLPRLEMQVPGAPGFGPGCAYTVRRSPASRRWGVFGCEPGSSRRTGGAKVRRLGPHRLQYVVRADEIGDPDRYRWHLYLPSRRCHDCAYDRIPDRGGKLHRLRAPEPGLTPIKHVVIIYQENHSFDNVLGRLCVQTGRCDGATTGTLPDGSTIPLRPARDLVPKLGHTQEAQLKAMNGGRMNGFSRVFGCDAEHRYACMTQYLPRQIPNLARLAQAFAISDRTFQLSSVSSFGAHIELVSADETDDGFVGDQPVRTQGGHVGPGWGCDSGLDGAWRATPDSPITYQPSCIPDYQLDPVEHPYGGAYRPTPVQPIPTIMDELDQAGLNWKLYTTGGGDGYLWAICPTFAGCIYTPQHDHQVNRTQILADAQAGSLPSFSVVLPTWPLSQHNKSSMARGDNWIGQVVGSIENGPDWNSTAIFITYDDCGCFYDHVPPPDGFGIRTPMVIVSPWVKPGSVDSHTASMASMLAFTEHDFGLPPLSQEDGAAYYYGRSFDFNQQPLPPVPMTHTKIPLREREHLSTIPKPTGGT